MSCTMMNHPPGAGQATDVEGLLAALPALGIFRAVAVASTAFPAWLAYGGSLLAQLDLDPHVRELAILRVALATGCTYERSQHLGIATGIGVPADQVDAVLTRRDGDLPMRVQLVVRAVDALAATHTLPRQLHDVLRQQLGERQTVELLLVIGWYVGVAHLANGIALAPDEPVDTAVVDLARAAPEAQS